MRRMVTGNSPVLASSYALLRPMPRMAPAVAMSVVMPSWRMASGVQTVVADVGMFMGWASSLGWIFLGGRHWCLGPAWWRAVFRRWQWEALTYASPGVGRVGERVARYPAGPG